MAKILATGLSASRKNMKTNQAFNKLFGNAIGNNATKRKIFSSFIAAAGGHAITKEVVRRTFQGAASKGVSKNSIREISGKVLPGEGASSRLRYLNDSESTNKSSVKTLQQKPKIEARKVVYEQKEQKRPVIKQAEKEIVQNNAPKALNFSKSSGKLHSAEHLFVKAPGAEFNNYERMNNVENIEDVKARLARIQEKPSEDKIDLAA